MGFIYEVCVLGRVLFSNAPNIGKERKGVIFIKLEHFLFDGLWFYDIFKVRWKTAPYGVFYM